MNAESVCRHDISPRPWKIQRTVRCMLSLVVPQPDWPPGRLQVPPYAGGLGLGIRARLEAQPSCTPVRQRENLSQLEIAILRLRLGAGSRTQASSHDGLDPGPSADMRPGQLEQRWATESARAAVGTRAGPGRLTVSSFIWCSGISVTSRPSMNLPPPRPGRPRSEGRVQAPGPVWPGRRLGNGGRASFPSSEWVGGWVLGGGWSACVRGGGWSAWVRGSGRGGRVRCGGWGQGRGGRERRRGGRRGPHRSSSPTDIRPEACPAKPLITS